MYFYINCIYWKNNYKLYDQTIENVAKPMLMFITKGVLAT